MFVHKTIAIAGLVATTMLASGCAFQQRDSFTVGAIPQDYRTQHPIVVTEQEQTLDIPVGTNTRQLSIPVKSNIQAFARYFAQSGSGMMHMLLPSGSANASAAAGLQRSILATISEAGADANSVTISHYDATQHGAVAPVRLSFNGLEATAGPCGQWTDNMVDTAENNNYAEFGCSTQANMAAILENPADLLGPRAMSPIDAAQRGTVYENYTSGVNGAASEVSY